MDYSQFRKVFNTNANAFLIALRKCICLRIEDYTTNVHIHSQLIFLYVALKEFYTHVNMLFIHYYVMLYVTISCKSSYGRNKDKGKKKKGLAFLLHTSPGTFLDISNKSIVTPGSVRVLGLIANLSIKCRLIAECGITDSPQQHSAIFS